MRFFQRFLLAGAFWAAASTLPGSVWGQEFVACSNPVVASPTTPSTPSAIHPKLDELRSLSESSATQVFQELVQAYTSMGRAAPTQIVLTSGGPHANAYVKDSETVVLSRSLVKILQEPADLWFVLAHEMAHIALHHPASTSQTMESQADLLALQILRERGLDPCSAVHVLDLLQTYEPHYAHVLSYRSTRIQTLLGQRCITQSTVLMTLGSRPLIR